MFAFTALFGHRNETLVRSCQPAMYSASAGFTRAAEVRFNALERRAAVVAKPASIKSSTDSSSGFAHRAAVALCGTVLGLVDDFGTFNNEVVDSSDDTFFLYDRMDPDSMNLVGDMMMN